MVTVARWWYPWWFLKLVGTCYHCGKWRKRNARNEVIPVIIRWGDRIHHRSCRAIAHTHL